MTMIVVARERGTAEWRTAHRGRVSASDSAAIMAKPGTKRRAALINRLVLDFEGHGLHTDEFPEPWAEQHEADLRAALAFYRRSTGKSVLTTGFVTDGRLTWLGCSPHGLIGSAGCVQFRLRQSLRSWHTRSPLSTAERAKLQLVMYLCGRKWVDVCDYWNGGGRVADRMRSTRVDFDENFVSTVILPKVLGIWRDVRGLLAKRR